MKSMQRDASSFEKSGRLDSEDLDGLVGELAHLLFTPAELESEPVASDSWFGHLADLLSAAWHVGRIGGLLDGADDILRKRPAHMREKKREKALSDPKEMTRQEIIDRFAAEWDGKKPAKMADSISAKLKTVGAPLSREKVAVRLKKSFQIHKIEEGRRARRAAALAEFERRRAARHSLGAPTKDPNSL